MKTLTEYQKAALDHSEERNKETGFDFCAGWVETPHGTLTVRQTPAHGLSTNMRSHTRKSWTLNDKRISAKNLTAKFAE